jgi:hypothetical protein
MTAPTPTTVELIERVFAALDYETLGSIYCHEGGAEFWEERREHVMSAGVVWARALCARLGVGRSLYVGAGVAELPALIVECEDLGREVRIASLNEPECESLNASLATVGLADRLVFQPIDAREAAAGGGFDHLSLVSVLTDPEHYPTVSDLSYGRLHPALVDMDAFTAERASLRSLVDSLLAALQTPAWVTTTAEDAPWLLQAAEARGLLVEPDDEAIETAVVGDPLGFLRIVQP